MTGIVSNEGPTPADRDGLSGGLANKLVSAAIRLGLLRGRALD